MPVAWKRRWVALISAAAIIGLASLAQALGPVWVVAIAASTILLASLHAVAFDMIRQAGVETPTGLPASGQLLACVLLLGVLMAIVGALLLVLLLALAFGVASAGVHFDAADPRTWGQAVDERGRAVLGIASALAAGMFAWVFARLAYAPVATIARGRVQVLSAWPLSRGLVLKTLAGLVATGAPAVVALLIWRCVAASPLGPTSIAGAVIAGLLIAGLGLPLNAGLMTYLYAQITQDSADA